MSSRLKRLAGAIVIMLFVLIYALVGAFVGDKLIVSQPMWIYLPYFVIAGILWIFPVGLVIRWMYRSPLPKA